MSSRIFPRLALGFPDGCHGGAVGLEAVVFAAQVRTKTASLVKPEPDPEDAVSALLPGALGRTVRSRIHIPLSRITTMCTTSPSALRCQAMRPGRINATGSAEPTLRFEDLPPVGTGRSLFEGILPGHRGIVHAAWLATALLLTMAVPVAQSPYLVKDIKPGNEYSSSFPHPLGTASDGLMWVLAETQDYGLDLSDRWNGWGTLGGRKR